MPQQMLKGGILNAQKDDLIYHPFQRADIESGYVGIILCG
jgi:hypothetical protein